MAAAVECARDANGVAVLRASGELGGAFGPEMLDALEACVEQCLSDDRTIGVVLAAGASGFFGELDLEWLQGMASRPQGELLTFVERAAALAARIDASPKPFAAAISADAKGVGLELALACHRRIGAAGAGYAVGFTDLRYGLPPMLGTAARLSAQMGPDAASKLLRDATALTPAAALKAGLIHELQPPAAVLEEATRWIEVAASQRPQKVADAAISAMLLPSRTGDTALATREFVSAATGPLAQDMVRTLGLSVANANRLASRPAGVPARSFRRVGVLGAGLMGSGIALVCARAGMQVTLVDMSEEAAQRGLAALAKQEASGVAAGRLDAIESQATLARIRPTSRYEELYGVDIVVEAVFEDREVKARATRQAEAAAGPHALFATNTSTLPITGLAEASQRPAQFIGLHFFSPVPRMPLLEIIRGQQTTDETLAHAMDFARAIAKTPIVVHDARGFYTTRVVMAYQAEAFDMLAQGVDPAVIEAGGVAAGMPVPPLALSDAVALDLIHQINLQTARDLGAAYTFTPGYAMVGRMVEDEGRKGKKSGQGFYDHAADGSKSFWPRLRDFASPTLRIGMSVADARDRLLAAQALETVRCLEEGVITDPSQCDVGAILGWGFAPWTGGPLSWIDRMGVREFVRRCDELVERCGSTRLEPSGTLRRLAEEGGSVYGASWPPA
ncbi:MAG: 3-hydroxyacyl-CoA dehydrogenase [Gammaproteobacteria bacterium]|nr:3-hydroxyacyl-CoA dehydrogenase [Gammaproteobacteria bacterium]